MTPDLEDDYDHDLLRLMRQRNALIFGLQCFRQRAVRGMAPDDLAEEMAEYLSAGGHGITPDHGLIRHLPDGIVDHELTVPVAPRRWLTETAEMAEEHWGQGQH